MIARCLLSFAVKWCVEAMEAMEASGVERPVNQKITLTHLHLGNLVNNSWAPDGGVTSTALP